MLTGRTPEAHQAVLARFRQYRSEGQFIPPGVGKETIMFPGMDGGGEWGGAAFDPDTGLLYVNSNEMAWLYSLVQVPPPGAETNGKQRYNSECASCHRVAGAPRSCPPRWNRPDATGRRALDDFLWRWTDALIRDASAEF
jgi:quinoprotein glucose dehydrogenase